MSEDAELLHRYATEHSEAAFTELIRRHVDLVYSAALRLVHGDVHRAEDVTQQVFAEFAGQAKKLARHPALTGWFYTTTRLIALRAIRTEQRRTAREREAHSMNELLRPQDAETEWNQLQPVLEDAMHELGEPDRLAVLLRFFQNKNHKEVGAALGLSENAARMRVDRALDKLRDHLARRGVTTTGGALSLAITANAVQAAPAGLAATISTATAAAIAGTAVQTSTTIATTKAIVMTTLQKTLIAATVVVAVGAGIYEAHDASIARTEIGTLRQQQAVLTQQVQQLQQERDETTNRLATAAAEIAQLKSGQDQAELLKLRGQVGTLRQQLAYVQAKVKLPSSGLEKIMADPATKDLADQQARREIKLRYTELFQELKLSPEQIEQFALTYANSAFAPPGTDVEGQLRSLLGEAGYARFKEFTQEVPARTTVKLLNSQLGASQLTDEQDAQLLQIVKSEPYNLTYGIEGDLNEAFFGAQDQIDNFVQQVTTSNQRVVQQAAAFLTPDQLAALNSVLTNALKVRIAQAAALVQKH
jgi:RNA polymerase sigma factor (sigma-70 family)